MKNIFGLIAIMVALGPCGALAQAQQPKKIPRIGYLSNSDPASESARSEAIRLALRERGYIEGQNIAMSTDMRRGNADRFPELAAELVRLKVDIIVVAGGTRSRRPRMRPRRFPSLWRAAGPIPSRQAWLKPCPSRRQRHRHYKPCRELGGKRLELLKEAVPNLPVSRFSTIRPFRPGTRGERGSPSRGARAEVDFQPWEVRGADGFDRVFAALNKERPDGLYVLASPLMFANQKRIVGFAFMSRLPSMYGNREFVDAGGLMSYGADLADSYRRVAYYVDRILKGAKPADLPVEQPTKFELVINLKTAKQIGVTIPQGAGAGGQGDQMIKQGDKLDDDYPALSQRDFESMGQRTVELAKLTPRG